MKLSKTQEAVLRRLESGDVLRWAYCGGFWQNSPDNPRDATITALRTRRLVALLPSIGTSRQVVLSLTGRAWLATHPNKT